MGNVPTEYNRQHYKSKLEARTACMLDIWLEYGIITEWLYEPEVMTFEDTDKTGKRRDVDYVPDFKVRFSEGGQIQWWECKGMVSAFDIT